MTKKEQKKIVMKRLKISSDQFEELYKDVRRANKKGRRKGVVYFSPPKYSTKLENIRGHEHYEKIRASLDYVLDTNYRKISNFQTRELLYANIYNFAGSEAQPLINIFQDMSDQDILNFFNENRDIASMLYDSDPSKLLKLVGETVEKFYGRLEYGGF